jgi:hypothetical protein
VKSLHLHRHLIPPARRRSSSPVSTRAQTWLSRGQRQATSVTASIFNINLAKNRTGNIIKVGADIRDWLPPRGPIAFAAFFPPCTDVAVSGARWFKDKGIGSLINALSLFDVSVKLAEWCEAPYMIENPVSTVSTYWRKPDYTFDPCEYGGYLETSGDAYTKKT